MYICWVCTFKNIISKLASYLLTGLQVKLVIEGARLFLLVLAFLFNYYSPQWGEGCYRFPGISIRLCWSKNGQCQKTSIPITQMTFLNSEGKGGSLILNSKGMGYLQLEFWRHWGGGFRKGQTRVCTPECTDDTADDQWKQKTRHAPIRHVFAFIDRRKPIERRSYIKLFVCKPLQNMCQEYIFIKKPV